VVLLCCNCSISPQKWAIFICAITGSQIAVHYIGCCTCNHFRLPAVFTLCHFALVVLSTWILSHGCLYQISSHSWLSSHIFFNRLIIENHRTIGLRQSFGRPEPIGTAPNINLQYELLITRIIRCVETVKQRPLRLTQIQILLQNGEECGENPKTSSYNIFIDRLRNN
jgi:hypothetical protein